MYPSELIHQATAGGRHVYKTQACDTQPALPPSGYALPPTPLLPPDTEFDPHVPSDLPVGGACGWGASVGRGGGARGCTLRPHRRARRQAVPALYVYLTA